MNDLVRELGVEEAEIGVLVLDASHGCLGLLQLCIHRILAPYQLHMQLIHLDMERQ